MDVIIKYYQTPYEDDYDNEAEDYKDEEYYEIKCSIESILESYKGKEAVYKLMDFVYGKMIEAQKEYIK